MILSFLRSWPGVLTVTVSSFFLLVSCLIFLGKFDGYSVGPDPHRSDSAAVILLMSFFGFLTAAFMIGSFHRSKTIPYLESGELYSEESFSEYYKRGKLGQVQKAYRHPLLRATTFPILGWQGLFLQVSVPFSGVLLSFFI